jgi:hypothetical protein
MMDFIPDDQQGDLHVPFYEDASSSLGIVGHATGRSERELKVEIERAMGHLGASVALFQAGKFGDRYGYRVEFSWGGQKGRIDVVALPIRKETASRIEKAKRHALYSVMLRLEAQFNTQLTMPGDAPLMPFMIDNKGRTMIEAMREAGSLPQLAAPDDGPIEAEFKEVA